MCHATNADPRCTFFRRLRGHVEWTVDAQQLLDTQAGTGGSVPHLSQMPWRFCDYARSQLLVDGVLYKKGYGYPGDPALGESNNCLIDSLRQALGDVECDRMLVRRDLQVEFGTANANNPRRNVTDDSYLDVECHWQAILRSLFRHNTSGRPVECDPNDYCVVALYGDREGNGIVLGNVHASHRLVIINWGDRHFDPCLRWDGWQRASSFADSVEMLR